jgi:hypothetical protein
VAAAVADDGAVHEVPEGPAMGSSGVIDCGFRPGEYEDESLGKKDP